MPMPKGTKRRATPGGVAKGLVSVELTDGQRALFGELVLWVGAALGEHAPPREEDHVNIIRRSICFETPRSSVPLHRTLLRGAKGHGTRTTTLKLRRSQAKWWTAACLHAATGFEDLPVLIRLELFKLTVPLAKGLTARRGKRPQFRDEDVAAFVDRLASKRSTVNPIGRAAAHLGVDQSTVWRALRRAGRPPSPAARALLSE